MKAAVQNWARSSNGTTKRWNKLSLQCCLSSGKGGLDNPDRKTDLYHRLRIGPIKKLYKYITPTATSLAGGSPMDSTFPFSNVTVQVKSYDEGKDQFTLQNSKDLKLNYHRGDGI